jgi:hypothetical protein
MAHTPAPWATDLGEHDERYQDIKITASDQRTVATVWIDDAPVPDFNDEQYANARLIAAAPDLLAACEAAEKHFGWLLSIGALDRRKDEPYVDGLRAAIAKAKGKTE